MNLDLPDFEPRFPWWGGDLQTLHDGMTGAPKKLPPDLAVNSKPQRFALDDGTPDVMIGTLDMPAKPIPGLPLVLLIHGAPGSATSSYMISMSRYMLGRGYRVLRINQRGAGRSRYTCTGQYSAGLSKDLHLLFEAMPAELTDDGIVAVGYSIGGAVLLKYLGEAGIDTPLLAAASVSAPIDLQGTCLELMRWRNVFYHTVVLDPMRKEALAKIAKLTPQEREGVEMAATIWEYDERFSAPRANQPTVRDYYRNCSAIGHLAGIRVPTLCLAALDDPWVPGSGYVGYYWAGNAFLTPLLTNSGGHVGFHGKGSDQPWRDLAVAEFLHKAVKGR